MLHNLALTDFRGTNKFCQFKRNSITAYKRSKRKPDEGTKISISYYDGIGGIPLIADPVVRGSALSVLMVLKV